MLISLVDGADADRVGQVMSLARQAGLRAVRADLDGAARVCLAGEEAALRAFPLPEGVGQVTPLPTPWKLAHRAVRPRGTVVEVGGIPFGGPGFVLVAGPCSIESYDQLTEVARAVRGAGAACLRGGAYKPRTSPYSFQGLEEAGLPLMAQVSRETGLPSFTEAICSEDVGRVAEAADAIQIGSRSMHNTRLLKAAARSGRPVLLKRGLSASLSELLLAAEYILAEGNPNVILCERGIRTFETATRNTLDLAGAVWLKQNTHLPVIVDPSHATGERSLIGPMALAAAACGVDGLIIEVHPRPKEALSDGAQALTPADLDALMGRLQAVLTAVDRPLVAPLSQGG